MNLIQFGEVVAGGADLAGTLTALGSVFEFIMSQIATVLETIVSTPLLFIPFGVIMTYTIISTVRRLW